LSFFPAKNAPLQLTVSV